MIKGNISRFRCICGRWCVDITEITKEMNQKGVLMAVEVLEYQDRLQQRCLG